MFHRAKVSHRSSIIRYSLSAATAVMLWMVLKKKPTNIANRVRTSKQW